MSLRIGFDIDGVVADFLTAFSEVASQVLSWKHRGTIADLKELSEGDTRKVWKVITGTPNWWLTLKPYEANALEQLYRLSRELKWEVVFMTTRVPTAGETVLFQSQWWLESQGFYLPSVVTVPGSRGDLANSLRLDLLVDDQLMNCADVIGASQTKALLMLRHPRPSIREQAVNAGIGVVENIQEAVEILHRLHALTPDRRRSLTRLTDWFFGGTRQEPELTLPENPRQARPLPDTERPRE
jgi:hypothetical protein